MPEKSDNWDFQWGQIVGRAWADKEFDQRLRADPAGILTEYGLLPSSGLRIEVLDDTGLVPEDTDAVMHLVLPAKPSTAALSEDDLCSVSGPVAVDRCGCGGCRCGACGGCGTCGGCVWCYGPDEN